MKKYCGISVLILCAITYFLYIYHSHFKDEHNNIVLPEAFAKTEKKINNKIKKLKYILQWTSETKIPFKDMGRGQRGFLDRGCPYNNCYVTSSRNFLGDYKNFDAIVFHGPEVLGETSVTLPKTRSPHQKFVFASIESAENYPACTKRFNGYFNWTWTYRLESDVKWGYITVRDKNNKVVGPKKDMQWLKLEDMDPVPENFKKKLKGKKKAAAWFVSNCVTKSGREVFYNNLEMLLLQKYRLKVDKFGSCGPLSCSQDKAKACDKKIADNYYFYLALENSFSEDYVTEKLVRALKNDAIPIVYGGANYSRFMPDGIYLNARELGVSKLAEKMHELISDPDKYAEYFKWKNHYSYHLTTDFVNTNEYCKMCELLNDENEVKRTTVYKDFQEWWDGGPCLRG